jgi:hypothetical protein
LDVAEFPIFCVKLVVNSDTDRQTQRQPMMTSTGGLSRRRNNNALGSVSGLNDYSGQPGDEVESPANGVREPLDDGDDDRKDRQLTLMEELLLLGLKDSQVG